MDNIILVHEIIHSFKSTRTSCMLIKLDLSKSFDCLSWRYMQSLLETFRFDKDWIHWIMKITSSTFFSILVNEVPSKPFMPSREIHQGDPLSPFLFIIMAKGLGRYIKASIEDGSLQGLPLHNLQPSTSHRQFMDDTLLMNTPTTKEALKLKTILFDFNEASSTTFNLEKSQVLFLNTPLAIQNNISRLLGISKRSLPSNYLGVLLFEAVLRNISWATLLLSLSNRLNSWTFLSLNLAARLVLIKHVLQALPTYLFSALAALKSVINSIRNLQRNFLWHGHDLGKKMGPRKLGKSLQA
jgi:hypothetical protein